MAATPYPTDYVYAGNATVLTLKTAVSDGGGDLTLTVNEETAAKGWPSLGAGQRFVIVVGRGTAYETKYAVKTITSSAAGSTLTVDSADKTFDNTPVTAAPTGTEVEHCWSATEASLANDHMRTKSAHGADGELVDQNTAQLLSNKTVMTPTAAGHPTTKSYVDAADALLLPKTGGTSLTMAGPIAMAGSKVTGLAAASANGDAVRYEQVVATYAEMERPSGTQSIPNGTTTVTYSTETDPSSIANTGTGQLSLTAGVWTLSYFSAVQGGDSYSHYLYAGSRTVDYGYGQTVGLNATVYLSGSTTVYAQIVNASSATTVALARLTAVRIGI